uniref:Putative secreted peptide n=1 Tax=Anopheles braziliensis TaxID=58242 RepID=A0A2M3ZQ29_9DIPT
MRSKLQVIFSKAFRAIAFVYPFDGCSRLVRLASYVSVKITDFLRTADISNVSKQTTLKVQVANVYGTRITV